MQVLQKNIFEGFGKCYLQKTVVASYKFSINSINVRLTRLDRTIWIYFLPKAMHGVVASFYPELFF